MRNESFDNQNIIGDQSAVNKVGKHIDLGAIAKEQQVKPCFQLVNWIVNERTILHWSIFHNQKYIRNVEVSFVRDASVDTSSECVWRSRKSKGNQRFEGMFWRHWHSYSSAFQNSFSMVWRRKRKKYALILKSCINIDIESERSIGRRSQFGERKRGRSGRSGDRTIDQRRCHRFLSWFFLWFCCWRGRLGLVCLRRGRDLFLLFSLLFCQHTKKETYFFHWRS